MFRKFKKNNEAMNQRCSHKANSKHFLVTGAK